MLRVRQHVVVYAVDDQTITVLRVLHRRMAVERHLP
jgi:plasmid stabilization system protein ParE